LDYDGFRQNVSLDCPLPPAYEVVNSQWSSMYGVIGLTSHQFNGKATSSELPTLPPFSPSPKKQKKKKLRCTLVLDLDLETRIKAYKDE